MKTAEALAAAMVRKGMNPAHITTKDMLLCAYIDGVIDCIEVEMEAIKREFGKELKALSRRVRALEGKEFKIRTKGDDE